jgi:hypothetical protein
MKKIIKKILNWVGLPPLASVFVMVMIMAYSSYNVRGSALDALKVQSEYIEELESLVGDCKDLVEVIKEIK